MTPTQLADRGDLWSMTIDRLLTSPAGRAALSLLIEALDAMPPDNRKLGSGGLTTEDGCFCAVGAMWAYRQVRAGSSWDDVWYDLEPYSTPTLDDTAHFAARKLDIPHAVAWEMAYMNDHEFEDLDPTVRYTRMHDWAVKLLTRAYLGGVGS